MYPFEWLTVVYFAALAAASPFAPASRGRARGAAAAILFAIVPLAAPAVPRALRIWLPHLYLVAGYWTPALLAEPSPRGTRFEGWLRRTDTVLRPAAKVPVALAFLFELAYLACYPLVPVALATVLAAGSPGAPARFWTATLAGGFASYALLPWLVSRPPRCLEPRTVGSGIGSVNARVLGSVSHGLNTFPSGHVAVSLTAALVAFAESPLIGIPLLTVAAGVAAGAVTGRYHYVLDVLAGIGVALLAVVLT